MKRITQIFLIRELYNICVNPWFKGASKLIHNAYPFFIIDFKSHI
ncbi:Uncharacterized protein dnm_001670 [Desulfonema magnum]|uniref:Uncharacterized protein n=1 Tax=Desulfonema magnum TaxID=45655 RepID=A0A975BFD9_9BACT|nr:Uncharacterized protein dnm_001670 [Desulfonema magnum]